MKAKLIKMERRIRESRKGTHRSVERGEEDDDADDDDEKATTKKTDRRWIHEEDDDGDEEFNVDEAEVWLRLRALINGFRSDNISLPSV